MKKSKRITGLSPLLSNLDIAFAMELKTEGCAIKFIAPMLGVTAMQLSNAITYTEKNGTHKNEPKN